MFEPLKNPNLFAEVGVDEFGVVCWPNGADLAPDALRWNWQEKLRITVLYPEGRSVDQRRLLGRLRRGHHQNVAFADFCALIEGMGFRLNRTTGSHRHYAHPALPEILTIQPLQGQAKPYQIRQLLRLVQRYNLSLEDQR